MSLLQRFRRREEQRRVADERKSLAHIVNNREAL
jgi:hypothetical protein